MSAKDPTERIWELMSDIAVAMVVTHDGHGDDVRARPMHARPEADDNAIYFLTDADAPKDGEVEANADVCLTFADSRGNRFVSVTGLADVVADRDVAAKIWKSADKAFWKDPDDPRLRILRVTPERGEFWEGQGLVSNVVAMIKSAATGARPNLGRSEKVAM